MTRKKPSKKVKAHRAKAIKDFLMPMSTAMFDKRLPKKKRKIFRDVIGQLRFSQVKTELPMIVLEIFNAKEIEIIRGRK